MHDPKSSVDQLFSSLSNGVSLADAVNGFLLDLQLENRTPKTIAYNRFILKNFCWYAEQMDFGESFASIASHDIKNFIGYLQTNNHRWGKEDHAPSNKPVSMATVQRYRAVLHAFWNWALREEMVEHNIVDRIRPPKVEQKIIDPLSESDIKKLVDVCRKGGPGTKRDLSIILVMLDTGVRLSELCGVKITDWDQSEARIKVYGKGRKERWVSLSPPTAKTIWDYIAKERGHSFYPELWLGKGQIPFGPSGVAAMLERRAEQAGIRHVNPHLLRHSFAFSWAKAGGPLHALQTLLGHTTPTMSMKYGRMASTDAADLHKQFSPVERMGLRFREDKPKRR